MEDYKDRIGEPVSGLLGNGQVVYGIYDGIRETQFNVYSHRILLRTNPINVIYCEEGKIEFLIPSVFRHYGKRARVWNHEDDIRYRKIIAIGKDGTCLAIDDLERFERGCKCLLFGNYKLTGDHTYTLIKDGEPVDLIPEQIRKIEEIMK